MALNIPTSSQWVTFPTKPGDVVWVSWQEGRIQKRATYYLTKCYWGNLVKADLDQSKSNAEAARTGKKDVTEDGLTKPVVLNSQASLKILGETKLFIATEYLEPQYRGGPMVNFHVFDAAGIQANQQGSVWVKMQLNECFRYGQDSSKNTKIRWLVYHPPIADGIAAPKMFQHRFTGLLSADFAKVAADDISNYVPKEYKGAAKAVGTLASFGTDAMRSSVGHELHPFLNSGGIAEAKAREIKAEPKAIRESRKRYATRRVGVLDPKLLRSEAEDEAELEWKRLVAIQFVETLRSVEENKAVDEGLKARLEEQAEMRRQYLADDSLWDQFYEKVKAWTNIRGSAKVVPLGMDTSKLSKEDKKALEEEKKAIGQYQETMKGVLDAAKKDQDRVELDFDDLIISGAVEFVDPKPQDKGAIETLDTYKSEARQDLDYSIHLDKYYQKIGYKPSETEGNVERNATQTASQTTNPSQSSSQSKPHSVVGNNVVNPYYSQTQANPPQAHQNQANSSQAPQSKKKGFSLF